MSEPDLFAEIEPPTCGNCGAIAADRFGIQFCALSYMTVDPKKPGCRWHEPRT